MKKSPVGARKASRSDGLAQQAVSAVNPILEKPEKPVGAKGVLGKSSIARSQLATARALSRGAREAEQVVNDVKIPPTPANPTGFCKTKSCSWNYGGECRCPKT